ncbi:helix-turn-helix domain-containing protein [Candidatus Enterococcus ferrettii]|uniref:Mga helix-turn-helix domain-containing protein n=1 Tax=Candidatus Enterococcus ferrettii TaxID=2815324 RepID=A0ABV0EL57_9ENTE
MQVELFKLLENRNKFCYKIIELFQVEQDWVEVQTVSTNLEISERSVQRYFHYLDETIEEYNQTNNKHVKFFYEKFKGIKLEFSDSSVEQLKIHLACNDENLQLLLDLCLLKTDYIKKYSEKKFISIYSIKQSVKKINQLLSSFNLTVDANKLEFVGEEKTVRFFCYIFLWTLFKNGNWPFEYIDEDRLHRTVDHVEDRFGYCFTAVHRKKIAYFIAVCLLRSKKKFFIVDTENWDQYINFSAFRRKELVKTVERDHQVFEENEFMYIFVILEMTHWMYRPGKVKDLILEHHQTRNTDVYVATNLAFKKFQKDFFEIPNGMQEIFYTFFFCTHLQSRIFPGIYFDLDDFTSLGESGFPKNLTMKLKEFIREMKVLSQLEIFDEEELLLKRYLLLFSYFEYWSSFEPKVEIAIDADLSFLVRERMRKMIQNHFDRRYNLEVIISNPSLKRNCLVVTNMPSINDTNTGNICVVDPPLRQKDFLIIEKRVDKLLRELY